MSATHVRDLCHDLRGSLNSLVLGLRLGTAPESPRLQQVLEAACCDLAHQLRLLEILAHGLQSSARHRESLSELVEDRLQTLESQGLAVRVAELSETNVTTEPRVASALIEALLRRLGRAGEGQVEVQVADAAMRCTIDFGAVWSRAAPPQSPGLGELGLGLLADLAETIGGRLEAETSPEEGTLTVALYFDSQSCGLAPVP